MEFGDVVDFLTMYNWVYDFQVTQFFYREVWRCIPCEWVEYLTSLSTEQLNALPFGIKVDAPATLRKFVETAQRHSLPREMIQETSDVNISKDLRKGMSAKKQHEVSKFAGVVHKVMSDCGASVMVDVGAGLGYLGQVMNAAFGYRVISLECEDARSHGSNRRVHKNNLVSSNFQTITCSIRDTKESCDNLRSIITDFLSYDLKHHCISHVRLQRSDDGCTHSNRTSKTLSESEDKKSCHVVKGLDGLMPPDHTVATQHSCGSYSHNVELSQGITDNSPSNTSQFQLKTRCIDQNNSTKDKSATQMHSQHQDVTETLSTVPISLKPVVRVVMVGLHCCGDLTPTMLRHFTQLECVAAICCVGCCYHRMTFTHGFPNNFPMSQVCKDAMVTRTWTVGQYALRLAAQETRERWASQTSSDHADHTRSVAYRSLLDLYLRQEGLDVSRLCRKLARKTSYTTLDEYVTVAWTNLSLASHDIHLLEMREKMRCLHTAYERYFAYIEPITVLQVSLQSVLESLIYNDRLAYHHQHLPSTQAYIQPVFDANVSPRNLAIIANKSTQHYFSTHSKVI